MNKWYGEFRIVLKNINLEVKKARRRYLWPFRSGKSTMIRCINRLEEHHKKGHIFVSGNELTEDLKNIEAVRRDVGMCFQHFNLFPHLTVLENRT